MADATTTFTIPGMRCGGCANNIRSVLARQDGIVRVQADPATKRVDVVYDPARATAGGIAAVLATLGYPATTTAEGATT